MIPYRIVKFIIALLFLGGLWKPVQGQSVCRFSGDFDDTTMDVVVKAIAESCDLSISYNTDLISSKKVYRLEFRQEPFDQALFKLIEDRSLELVKISEDKYSLVQLGKGHELDAVVMRRVEGVVVDGSSGTGLPGVAVVIGDEENGLSNRGVLTDEFGRFELIIPTTQGDFLEARSLGYQSDRTVIPPYGSAVLVLSELPLELESVVVTGSREEVFRTGRGTTLQVSPRHLDAISVLGEKDVFRSMQMLPGVSATEESSNGVFVRGSTPDQTLVLIDGVPVYNTGHFFGMFHAFNADALDRVDVSRGGFNVSRGGAVAGLIDIESKPRIGDSLSGGINANLAATSAHINLPLAQNKAAFMVAGRRSYSDILQSPLYGQISDNVFQVGSIAEAKGAVESSDSAFFEADPLSNFHDIHAKAIVDLGKQGRLAASFYNGRDVVRYSLNESDQEEDFQRTSEERLTLVNNAGGIKYDRELKDGLELNLHTYLTNYRGRLSNDYQLVDETDTLDIYGFQDNQVRTGALRAGLSWKLSNAHQFQFGLQGVRTATDFFISNGDDDEEEDNELDSLNLAGGIYSAWAGYTFSKAGKFELSPGVRLSWYGINDQILTEPRVQMAYNLVPGLRLNGNFGVYLQYLNPVQINNNLKLGTEFLTLSSEDSGVDGIQSYQGGIGISWLKPGIWIDVQGYWKYLDGLQRYNREFDPNLNGNTFGERLSDGEGTILGADLLVRGHKGPWSGWLGYTISSVIHYFPDLNQDEAFPADHDHTHELKLANTLSVKKWEFSLMWSLASGKPYSTPSGVRTITDSTDTYIQLDYDQLNSLRLPAYHRMDLTISYQLPVWSWGVGKVGLSIFNIYNRDNIRERNFTVEYPDDPNDPLDIVPVDRELLGFSPNVFFRLTF